MERSTAQGSTHTTGLPPRAYSPLLVDLYELTMSEVYRREGMADRPSTFSLFVRNLPSQRGYLVAAGLDDALTWLEELHFSDDDVAAIDGLGLFSSDFLDWLRGVRFTGAVRAVPEGTIVFPHEPILEVDAPLAEAQLAETFLLNQITVQTVLASKAARCRHAADGRAVVDFALRRTQGVDAGMKLARVAKLVGMAGTSNVAAAVRYSIPASGTMAHSFIQAHADETGAFEAYTAAFGEHAVLLVDTYDTHRGIETAIAVTKQARRGRPGAVRALRLDSGDLSALAHHARRRLDDEGLGDIEVFASGGLDEYAIHRLVADDQAPIDGFGVGSALGVSDDAPNLDTVYKLVAFDGRPTHKTSPGKQTWPGPKQVWRAADWSSDVISLDSEAPPASSDRPLLETVMRDGRRVGAGTRSLEASAAHFDREWRSLPAAMKDLLEPALHPVRVSQAIQDLTKPLRT